MGRLLLELGPCLLLGLAAGRRWPLLADRLAPGLLRWGMPVSLMALLLRAGLQPQTAGVAAFTLFSCGAGLLLTRLVPALRSWLPQRSLQLGAVVGNTAYVGLPVAMALLPPQALAISITVDLVGTLVTWSLGPMLLADSAQSRLRALLPLLLRTPVIRGLILAIPVALTPWSRAVADGLWMPARLVLWTLLTLVGMRLGALLRGEDLSQDRQAWLTVVPATLIKLLCWPALLLALALPMGWPAWVVSAVVLQAAVPTAMSVLLLAEACPGRQRPEEVSAAARLVLVTTLTSAITVPCWAFALARLRA
jgi:predicted permease